MDNQTPWQPGQNPEGQTPPAAPPSGPYAPPGGYQPPPSQPYMPPQEQLPGGYPPPSYSPPPPQKKGFNWLACCGISCAVILVIGVIIFAVMFKSCSGLMGMGMRMQAAQQKVQSTDIATIKSQATTLSLDALEADLKGNEGQWVALEGVLGVDSQGVGSGMGSGGQQVPSTNYFIEPNVVLMDISVAPPVGSVGDTVRAWGQYTVMDLKDIPFVGKMIEEEMKKDPNVMGGKTTIVLFTAKEVELVSAAPPAGEGAAGGGADWGGGENPPPAAP